MRMDVVEGGVPGDLPGSFRSVIKISCSGATFDPVYQLETVVQVFGGLTSPEVYGVYTSEDLIITPDAGGIVHPTEIIAVLPVHQHIDPDVLLAIAQLAFGLDPEDESGLGFMEDDQGRVIMGENDETLILNQLI